VYSELQRQKERNQTTVEIFLAVFCHRISTEIHLLVTQRHLLMQEHILGFRGLTPLFALNLISTHYHCVKFTAGIFINTRMELTRIDKSEEALWHEGVWGSGCIDPRFLELGISWRWVVSFTPRPLYPRGKNPRVPIRYEAGWAPEPVWTIWRSENSCPHRYSNSDPSVVHPVSSLYTDWAIPALEWYLQTLFIYLLSLAKFVTPGSIDTFVQIKREHK
jgi:hypothetical protein